MRRAILIAVCLMIVPLPGFAWGVKGHAWIAENAVRVLPEGELKQYMEQHAEATVGSSNVPDAQWKEGLIAKLEAPNHYIDLEVFAEKPTAADVPRTKAEAALFYTRQGKAFSEGGFLPWRIEELYLALANAFKTNPRDVPFYAGVLSHYTADATNPLHLTIHYNGRVDRLVNGEKLLRGIHWDYEGVFLQDHDIEFQASSLALAQPPRIIKGVFGETMALVLDSFAKVDLIYAVAEEYNGEDKYAQWAKRLGPMTRGQLARASTFTASLWLSAWREAGSPTLTAAE